MDFAIHQPHAEGDVRNFHAHVLMTTRTVGPDGLGEKTLIERENKWLLNHNQPTSHMQLRDIRQAWENHANRHLARAGLDIRIDHRSHLERGLEIEPTEHMGVFASQMDRRGLDVLRTRIDEKAARTQRCPHPGKAGAGAVDPDGRKERVRPARRGAGAASLYRR